ncbi:hypothetical protein AVEN_22046-1 [Araneus ventricosus]|uniref:Uncharacterized protein n=1 Tax=Araneus ventricosus TaxID=182803 RepID=A0A4Y2VWA2_ARAVE|nr:hypothetical protein AVEN_22046-1 [Araneus ventricosus]
MSCSRLSILCGRYHSTMFRLLFYQHPADMAGLVFSSLAGVVRDHHAVVSLALTIPMLAAAAHLMATLAAGDFILYYALFGYSSPVMYQHWR